MRRGGRHARVRQGRGAAAGREQARGAPAAPELLHHVAAQPPRRSLPRSTPGQAAAPLLLLLLPPTPHPTPPHPARTRVVHRHAVAAPGDGGHARRLRQDGGPNLVAPGGHGRGAGAQEADGGGRVGQRLGQLRLLRGVAPARRGRWGGVRGGGRGGGGRRKARRAAAAPQPGTHSAAQAQRSAAQRGAAAAPPAAHQPGQTASTPVRTAVDTMSCTLA